MAVVSTAKVQKIWEQFTTSRHGCKEHAQLFRLQKYKKFESNSQLLYNWWCWSHRCFDCKSTKNLRAIHNFGKEDSSSSMLFRLQKYKKFESNSQLIAKPAVECTGCFDCKSTKNLRAIHNNLNKSQRTLTVVSTAKVQKIWEQFTTIKQVISWARLLFRLQKYKKFESNSQPRQEPGCHWYVVSTAKVQKIWEQFTTGTSGICRATSCFDCKSTKNLRAIHNKSCFYNLQLIVVSTAKVQKIWEQFTTQLEKCYFNSVLFRLQKYKKFESNSQHPKFQYR